MPAATQVVHSLQPHRSSAQLGVQLVRAWLNKSELTYPEEQLSLLVAELLTESLSQATEPLLLRVDERAGDIHVEVEERSLPRQSSEATDVEGTVHARTTVRPDPMLPLIAANAERWGVYTTSRRGALLSNVAWFEVTGDVAPSLPPPRPGV